MATKVKSQAERFLIITSYYFLLLLFQGRTSSCYLFHFGLYLFNIVEVITAGEILQALGRELRVLVYDC
jgi:hypothetical protein